MKPYPIATVREMLAFEHAGNLQLELDATENEEEREEIRKEIAKLIRQSGQLPLWRPIDL